MERDQIIIIWERALNAIQTKSSKETIDFFLHLPNPDEVEDAFFLTELAWCIYNAGMKEYVVRSKWNDITRIFSDFDAHAIIAMKEHIPKMIKPIFNHQGKCAAVIQGAEKILHEGPMKNKLRGMSEMAALQYLQEFPYIGKITCYHIARNIGFDVVKPDRHLVRLAEAFHTTPDLLVDHIAALTGKRRGFIDFVLWQWMAWEGSKIIREMVDSRPSGSTVTFHKPSEPFVITDNDGSGRT